MTDIPNDALCAEPVVVWGLMAATPQIEELERAAKRRDLPLGIAKMSVTDAELLERGEAEEGGQAQLPAEERVVGDVLVSFHDRHKGPCTDEVGCMQGGAGDTVEREVAEVGDGGGDGHDEPFAPVYTETEVSGDSQRATWQRRRTEESGLHRRNDRCRET